MAGEHVTEDLDKFHSPWVSEEHSSLFVIYRRLPQYTTITFGWWVIFITHTERVGRWSL
jgi:hypothetical protein